MSGINNFYQLISQKNIIIPMIQRDYAQGRKSDEINFIRRDLIKDIFSALQNNKPLDLNFIYGIVKCGGNDFLPIDGQQRLTSLYLLCWFCAAAEGKTKLFCNNTKQFDYQIRRTSSAFFGSLSMRDENGDLKYSGDFKKYALDENVIMENFGWFKTSWIYDPTVTAALTFLNEVRRIYSEIKNEDTVFTDAMLSDDCPIRFVYVCQNEQEQASADEMFSAENRAAHTYINMNARGKTLNNFENFKALLHGTGDSGKNFVKNYDCCYINYFLKLVEKKEKKLTLPQKVDKTDELTLGLLLHLYNDLSKFSDSKFDNIDIYSFMDALRDRGDSVFPEYYFELIEHIMSIFPELSDQEGEAIYEYCNRYYLADRCNFFLTFWYECRTKKKGVCDKEGWKRLCEHLGITSKEWYDAVDVIYNFVNYIAKENKNIADFLCSTYPEDIYKDIFFSKHKLTVATLREEQIKAQIYRKVPASLGLLEKTGKRHGHKIRYLLYISGYWDDADRGNWESFEKYAQLDEACQPNNSNILWRKAYYVASLPEDDGSALPEHAETTIWNAGDLIWHSQEDMKRKLPIIDKIKKIYDKLTSEGLDLPDYLDKIKNKLKPSCWLYYILDRNYIKFFENKINFVNGEYLFGKENFFNCVIQCDFDVNGYREGSSLTFEEEMDEIRVEHQDYNYGKNMLIKVSYSAQFENNNNWKYSNKNNIYHRYKYSGIIQDEDVFDCEKDVESYNCHKEIFISLFEAIKDIVKNDLNANDYKDMVFDWNCNKLQDLAEALLNKSYSDIKLEKCEKQNQRNIVVKFKSKTPVKFKQASSQNLSHSKLLKQI